MHLIKLANLLLISFLLTACLEDLTPESKDLRSMSDEDPSHAENFIATTTLNQSIMLKDELLTHDAVVLYFTMWCPLCDSHMSHIRSHVINHYPNVAFYMVDYVSGNISQSRSSQVANGYKDLTLLVDNLQSLLNTFDATMASVVVIDNHNSILLNEDYKDGSRLINTLNNI
ncbi:MAG: hypothetical protein HRU08_08900 [Oleispira sp.]|nr:hypothetical protein [Oleispira sp.]